MILERDKLIAMALKSDADAISFCSAFGALTQIWDDIYDRDNPVSGAQVNAAFKLALLTIPQNPFYRRFEARLFPLISAGILDWEISNQLADGSDSDRALAYVLRDSVGAVILECVRIVGGNEWVESLALDIRRAVINDESISQYMSNLP